MRIYINSKIWICIAKLCPQTQIQQALTLSRGNPLAHICICALCLIVHVVCVIILDTKLNMIVFVFVLGEVKDFRRNQNLGCAERRNEFHPTAQTNKRQECSRNERQKPPEKEVGGWDKETELL
jgi:hypothetical protein